MTTDQRLSDLATLQENIDAAQAALDAAGPINSETGRAIVKRLLGQIQKQSVLVEVAKLSGSKYDVISLLRIIVKKLKEVVDVDRSSLFLVDMEAGRDRLWTIIAEGLEKAQVPFITLPLGTGIVGWCAENRKQLIVNDVQKDPRWDRSVDQRTGYLTNSILATPLIGTTGKPLGVIEVINKNSGDFSQEDGDFLRAFASVASVHLETAYLNRDLEIMFDPLINMVAQAVDERDPCTAGHSRRVKKYSRTIAMAINRVKTGPLAPFEFSSDDLRQLEIAALLHDVGKVGVRENVLNKAARLSNQDIKIIGQRIDLELTARSLEIVQRGDDLDPELMDEARRALDFIRRVSTLGTRSEEDAKRLWEMKAKGWVEDCEYEHLAVTKGNLTKEEWDHMQSHVTKSQQLLSRIHWPAKFERVPEIAFCHHEKLNGKGYPRGLRAEDICIESQIVTVADIYDALTAHDRPYKPPMPHERAANILTAEANGGFINQEVVELFLGERLYVSATMG